MKESVLRAAAIASLALALIMSVTTWVGLSSSSQRGSFFIGFFEFALILFLGVVAWALFNALADIVTVRTSMDVLSVRMRRIEEALGVAEASTEAATHSAPASPPDPTPDRTDAGTDAGADAGADARPDAGEHEPRTDKEA